VPDSIDGPFTDEELTFFQGLTERGVRFVLVGLSAAVVQGADTTTQALDVWIESLGDSGIGEAAHDAGGFFATRTHPPMIGGRGLERIDVVTHCDGLEGFDAEYARTKTLKLGEVELRVLDLERIIASKEAAGRPKDLAVLPALRAALAAARG